MKIKIITSPQHAQQATGVTVVIDVLRAFSTACFIFQNQAEKIIPLADIDQAYRLKKENPQYILMGERHGLKQPGFDYGNSPTEIKNINFKNKVVILTTSRGTQAIFQVKKATIVLTGAFVNAQAIVSYIMKSKPTQVSLICTDDHFPKNEDYMCAFYIKSLLENKPLNFEKIKKDLARHPLADGFLRKPLGKYSVDDFHACLTLDLFNFVIKAVKENNNLYLQRLNIK